MQVQRLLRTKTNQQAFLLAEKSVPAPIVWLRQAPRARGTFRRSFRCLVMTDAEKILVKSIVELAWARKMLGEMSDDLKFKNLGSGEKEKLQREIGRLEARIRVLATQCKTFSQVVFQADTNRTSPAPKM
jgi:hypothetical protein